MTQRDFGIFNAAINPGGQLTTEASGVVRIGGITLPSFATDVNNNITGVLGAPGAGQLFPQPGYPDHMFKNYSALGFDFALASGLTVGVTDLTHSVTNEQPRWTGYSRKCVLGATGVSELRFSQFTPVSPDPTNLSLQAEIYIENYLTEFASPNAYIDVAVSPSTTTAIGADYSRWSFAATALKQGWNTLKFRAADTVSATPGDGNLPSGVTRPPDVGAGFNFVTQDCGFLRITFNNMPSQNVYVDQLRLPAKAQSVLVLGFDASAANASDNVFPDKVAPLFAQYGIKGYCTFTNIYELLYAGSTSWDRLALLYNTWGWDVINHSWSHGAGSVGRNAILTSLVSDAASLSTAVFSAVHGLAIGSKFRARIRGSSVAAQNIVAEFTVTTTTAATATTAGSGAVTPTGTITLNTFLGEVFATDTTENRRGALFEFQNAAEAMKAVGFSRGLGYTVYPNGSYCEKAVMQYAADASGIRIGRASRYGYTPVSELGIDNALSCGAFEMTSGTTGTRTSVLEAKIAGATSRGEHIHIFGHFIVDDTNSANAAFFPLAANGNEYPPGMNGNPNPPAASLSGTGGWWYYSQLVRFLANAVGPAIASGELLVMSPAEYVAYMGDKS